MVLAYRDESLTFESPEASCNRRADTYFGRRSASLMREFWILSIFLRRYPKQLWQKQSHIRILVLRRISYHGRNCSQPYFFKRNQSSDNRSHGFGAKFLLKNCLRVISAMRGNPPLHIVCRFVKWLWDLHPTFC